MQNRRKLLIVLVLLSLTIISLLTSNHVLNYKPVTIKSVENLIENEEKFNSPLNLYQNINRIKTYPNVNVNLKTKELKIPYKLFHLDLKGSPPRLDYLIKLLKSLNETGCNGILLEYEDMFPFHSELQNISHLNSFNEFELTKFLLECKKYELEIIPLIQTFGHLEFFLKYGEFRTFREVDEFPQEICPRNLEAVDFVKNILEQVLNFHEKIGLKLNYIHIGCDEVFHIGVCKRCKETPQKDLFTNHVKSISTFIKSKYNLNVIIWDDMLRKFYQDELSKSELGKFVEIMVWDYTENVDHLVSPFLWPMYALEFKHIWVASAFKGAFGEGLAQVEIYRHLLNHISWLSVLDRENPRIANFRGIALTGWSRYDHFSVLCELLPIAIPSLYASLLILKHQNLNGISQELSKKLSCPNLQIDTNLKLSLENCIWPGHDLYMQMNNLKYYEEVVGELIKNWRMSKGWLTFYNLKFNESSIWRLEEPKQIATGYLNNLKSFNQEINSTFIKYFEHYVYEEFYFQKIYFLVNQLESFIKDIEGLKKINVFKRRPLKYV